MKKKSLTMNAIMSGVRSILSILFPLITFPYVSRVLQVENLGKYNFANSVCSYFVLLAGLGISTYAIREGSKLRENREQVSRFASQMYTINLASSALSYLALVLVVAAVPRFRSYGLLIAIFSIQILFAAIGAEWVFTVFEEFGYITIRGIAFQVVGLILLFLFVKRPEDYYKYALITVFSSVGANGLNWFRLRRYCDLRLVRGIQWGRHLKPILIIFATSLATMLYVESDITILGLLTDDYHVGIYSVSVKVYKIVKSFLSSALVVSIPRFAHYIGMGETKEYNRLFRSMFHFLLLLVAPAVTGLICLSRDVVLLISDPSYLPASTSLQILSAALFVCLFGWLYNACVLIPQKREKYVMYATVVSALVNILFNLILVPLFQENAAAFTTVLAEAVSMVLCIFYARGLVDLKVNLRSVGSVLVGCAGIVACCTAARYAIDGFLPRVAVSVFGSCAVYFLILALLKNEMVRDVLQKAAARLRAGG